MTKIIITIIWVKIEIPIFLNDYSMTEKVHLFHFKAKPSYQCISLIKNINK